VGRPGSATAAWLAGGRGDAGWAASAAPTAAQAMWRDGPQLRARRAERGRHAAAARAAPAPERHVGGDAPPSTVGTAGGGFSGTGPAPAVFGLMVLALLALPAAIFCRVLCVATVPRSLLLTALLERPG
jgi:hypothetical protein